MQAGDESHLAPMTNDNSDVYHNLSTISLGDERRGTPMLIAVSSFGESLRRVYPPHRPGGGVF